MAPVQLPPPPSKDFGPFPPQPRDPPTIADFTRAREYEESLLDSLRRTPCAEARIALQQAKHYHWLLHENFAHHQRDDGDALNLAVQNAVDVAMARFEAILQERVPALINNTLEGKFHALDTKLEKFQQDMKRDIAKVDKLVTMLSYHVYKEYNLTCLDGSGRRYTIVPFPDGTLPTDPLHNLPPLYSKEDIINLSRDHVITYHARYALEAVRDRGRDYVERIRKAVARHIGCQDLDESIARETE